MRSERGSTALLTLLLLPMLLLSLAASVELAMLRVVAARVRAAADLAVLIAVNDQDDAALAQAGRLVAAPDADAVARTALAVNLAPLEAMLADAPQAIAGRADVVVLAAPATVILDALVPIRTQGLVPLGLPSAIVVRAHSVAGAR